ncbi:MAG: [dimethylamine--corrinoid protein] Co-methyltransferase [Clostridia bacterium]|nr:[dimethylamine--corrinoid protein] Co-methyltransferase [Clostridia bacterium]
MSKYFIRMGDGYFAEFTEAEIRQDLEDGTVDAAERGSIPPLSEDELQQLFEICTAPNKFVSVERGNELVLTFDAGTLKIPRLGVQMGRSQVVQLHEKAFGADTMELAHIDYSFKPIKAIVHEEQAEIQSALLNTVLPLFYGAMPNLGLYTKPDGPVENPAELLPKGKIAEARAAQEEAIEHAVKDMVYVASKMYEAGADGINFDTVGASGDADFLATLKAVEILKKKYPDMCIELGMAGEFVLGMHGDLYYDGVRLAGLYPHEQVKIAEKAGATIFGSVVNTNSSMSFTWNLARAITFSKTSVEHASIPVHANVGMGVGGIPVSETPAIDAVSRVSKAMAEVGKLDGL